MVFLWVYCMCLCVSVTCLSAHFANIINYNMDTCSVHVDVHVMRGSTVHVHVDVHVCTCRLVPLVSTIEKFHCIYYTCIHICTCTCVMLYMNVVW